MSNNNATNQTDSKSPQTIQHIPLPPPGCDWYYSLLKTTEAQQEAVAALLALNHALYTAATAQKDPSIAHKKLAWWDEELKRLFNGTPTHPITQALLPMMTMYTWPKAYFDDMFAGAIFIRDATRAFSEHQLKIQGQRAFGAVFALCGGVFVNDPQTQIQMAELGAALYLTQFILTLRQQQHLGKLMLPIDLCIQYQLDEHSYYHGELSPALKSVIQTLTNTAYRLRAEVQLALKQTDKQKLAPLLIYAELNFTLLNKLMKKLSKNDPQWDKKVDLTPIRRWWIATMTTRQCNKKRI